MHRDFKNCAGKNFELSLSPYKLSLSSYVFSLSLYKLSLSLQLLPRGVEKLFCAQTVIFFIVIVLVLRRFYLLKTDKNIHFLAGVISNTYFCCVHND